MCGICGIVDFSGDRIDPLLVQRMRDAMIRRGPDDAGSVVLPHVGLGHRRLSIIDLSPRGRQPMTNEDGSVWLVYNGEVYDFEPLQRSLISAGHRFVSDSDSEVLVHGYEEWGITGLVERINGMFAIAIWDAQKKQLHLVRDRLGKKPLYYGQCGGRFVFASELKALWTLAPGQWKVRPESIARFLYWSYSPGRETIYRDIFQLLPARILTIDATGEHERRFWQLSFAAKVRTTAGEAIDETDRVLTAAVRRRLRSDVPLGAFLSGGIDSSYVVSRMAAGAGRAVRTFTMGTSDGAHDERSEARAVATYCRTDHTEFEVTADTWSLLPKLVWEFGQPFGDGACIPTYLVAQRARQAVTVALTGDGGDESFAGYSQHQGRQLGALLARCVPAAAVGGLRKRMLAVAESGKETAFGAAARFLRYMDADPLVNWAGTDYWTAPHSAALWTEKYRDVFSRQELLRFALEVDAEYDGTSALDRALHHDLSILLPFCYNVKLDVATMMTSLEARSPFQDREVIEWAARVPANIKAYPWERKALLKRVASRWLPHDIVYRPKHGFTLPIDRWFRGSWSSAAHDIIFSDQARARGYFDFGYLGQVWDAHVAGRASHGSRLWALLWLELWHRMFIDQSMSVEDAALDSSVLGTLQRDAAVN